MAVIEVAVADSEAVIEAAEAVASEAVIEAAEAVASEVEVDKSEFRVYLKSDIGFHGMEIIYKFCTLILDKFCTFGRKHCIVYC